MARIVKMARTVKNGSFGRVLVLGSIDTSLTSGKLQLKKLGFSGVNLIFWVGPAWLPLLGLPLFASATALQLRYKKENLTNLFGNRLGWWLVVVAKHKWQ